MVIPLASAEPLGPTGPTDGPPSKATVTCAGCEPEYHMKMNLACVLEDMVNGMMVSPVLS